MGLDAHEVVRNGLMPGALQSTVTTDLSGGENLVTSPYLVGPKQSQQVNNFLLDEHGSLRVRDGTLLQLASLPSNVTGKPIVNVYDFIQVAGTVNQVGIVYQSGSANTLYNRATSPWTAIGNYTTAEPTPQLVTFTDKLITAPGYETIKKWDGVTFAVATGAPQAKHIAVHLSYLWAWNTLATTSTASGPSSLQASDVNNVDSWPSANQTFISKDDGQTGQGIGLFTIAETGISPTAALIAFKDRSAYEVTGTFGSTAGISVQLIKSDMGCVAPRTIQFVSGFGIIRLTHKGFALFDGVNDTLISEEIRPRLFGRDNFTAIRWANVNLSYATQVQNPPLYICVCPVNDTSLTRMFVYDLIRKSWSHCTFQNAMSSIHLIADPNTLPVVLGGDYSGSYVRRYFAGDATDDGTAISWTWVSRPIFNKSPMSRTYFRRALIKAYGFTNPSTVTASFNLGPTAIVNVKNITLQSALTSFAGYGLDAWGTTGYGAAPTTQNVTDIDFNLDIGAIGNNCYLTLNGTGQGRIRGIEWHWRPKALTRSTIAA